MDLLTIRADRDVYYYGCEARWSHVGFMVACAGLQHFCCKLGHRMDLRMHRDISRCNWESGLQSGDALFATLTVHDAQETP